MGKTAIILYPGYEKDNMDPSINNLLLDVLGWYNTIIHVYVPSGAHELAKRAEEKFQDVSIIPCKDTHPAYVFNTLYPHIKESHLLFVWPGCEISSVLINKGTEVGADSNLYCVYDYSNPFPYTPDEPLLYGWCMTAPLFKLNQLLIPMKAVHEIGDMDTSELLENMGYDWEYTLRLLRYCTTVCLGGANPNKYEVKAVSHLEEEEKHKIHGFVVRKRPRPYKNDAKFLEDYMTDYYGKNNILTALSLMRVKKPYKILIVGGYWDYHHNQLCFFNILDTLYGEGIATYRVAMDINLQVKDIGDADLVIFTRCRQGNILGMIDYCNMQKIPTMYMLDDNWINIAEDFPGDYGQMFSPGSSDYDVFYAALQKCKGVITFTEPLSQVLSKVNSNVYLMPLSIQMSKGIREKTEAKVVGYMGSLRYSNQAFYALKRIRDEYPSLTVILIGTLSNEQRYIFSGSNVIYSSYLAYPHYQAFIEQYQPDILIAPLEGNRTCEAKCPNKYLEMGSMRAAGIYSNVRPYTDVIEQNINGILVEEETVEHWYNAIKTLIDNTDILHGIQLKAYEDVNENYGIPKVKQRFIKVLKNIIEE